MGVSLPTKKIKASCYLSYCVQATVGSFFPLLFVFFNSSFGLSVGQLSFLAMLNFLTQLLIDLASTFFIGRIGYKAAGILGHACAFLGFVLFAILPFVMNPFWGIFISVVFYALGGGLIEVIISPVMEKVSIEAKASSMGILHGAYCFGVAFVVLVSFLYFLAFGTDKYSFLSLGFSIIPLICIVIFASTSFPSVTENVSTSKPGKFNVPLFIILLCCICCSGAIELGIAQWASAFVETSLSVKKPYGDLLGPLLFALTQGITRVAYGLTSKKINVRKLLFIGGLISILGYVLSGLSNVPVCGFIGMILVAVGVAPMWPGIITIAGERFGDGNPKAYSLLALFGDIGCGLGTYLVGIWAEGIGLSKAIAIATVYPCLFVILFICALLFEKKKTNK